MSNEAAKYRVRLREVEAALTDATERIDKLMRREAEQVASQHLAEPGDLWTFGEVTPADLLDDEGNVSPAAVTAVAEAIAAERPGLRKPARAVDPTQGRSMDVKSEPSWSSLLS